MRFENLLSRRYIFAQKRHSLLTISSIVIAVALMTMLFTAFTTLNSIQRAALYDAMPYHIEFFEVNSVQAKALSEMKEVVSSEITENQTAGHPTGTYRVRLMLGTYIEQETDYVINALVQLKIAPASLKTDSYNVQKISQYAGINSALLAKDLLTLSGRFNLVQSMALFCVLIVALALALRLVIDTAFEVSSRERERQFGVLQSIGATPKQIVRIITHEGLTFSAVAVPIGAAVGIGLAFLAYRAVLSSGVAEVLLSKEKADQLVHFHVNPWMTLAAMAVGTFWVWLSAYSTGMRIIRKSPIEAISARSNTIKKVRKFSIFGLLFGWTGKLAARNARRQPKRFIVTVLSLTLSLTLFAGFNLVLDGITDMYNQVFTLYDIFGSQHADFELSLAIPPNTRLIDPCRYHEAEKLLQDSGLFKEIEHLSLMEAYPKDTELENCTPIQTDEYYYIQYLSEATFNRLYADQEPPLSYEELKASGAALILCGENAPDRIKTGNEITVTAEKHSTITQEEYEALQERKKAGETNLRLMIFDAVEGIDEDGIAYAYPAEYGQRTAENITCRITAHDDFPKNFEFNFMRSYGESVPYPTAVILFADQAFLDGDWENYGDFQLGDYLCCRADKEENYAECKRFLEKHPEMFNPLQEWQDRYGEQKNIRTIIAAVRIAVNFVNIMIALIALVNMVNIISTGILNRKSELAAMQCVGMTQGQMYRMTAIESLQYVFGAAIGASAVCAVLIWCMELMLKAVDLMEEQGGRLIPYTQPLPRIWVTAGVAFLIALITSLIPLLRMQKEPLVDQIRSVE